MDLVPACDHAAQFGRSHLAPRVVTTCQAISTPRANRRISLCSFHHHPHGLSVLFPCAKVSRDLVLESSLPRFSRRDDREHLRSSFGFHHFLKKILPGSGKRTFAINPDQFHHFDSIHFVRTHHVAQPSLVCARGRLDAHKFDSFAI